MTEKVFYETCDKLENAELPSGMGAYYPTVETLKESIGDKPLDDFLPVILFYASDPFKDEITAEDYKETVRYAKELTSKISLT